MFVNYTFPAGDPINIVFTINDAAKIVDRGKSTDTIEIMIDSPREGKAPPVILRMVSDKSRRTFTLKNKGTQEPEKSFSIDSFDDAKKKITASFNIDGGMFDELVKDALVVSDTIKISMSKERVLTLYATNEAGEVDTEIDTKEREEWKSASTDEARGTYSLSFLENVLKLLPILPDLKVSIGKDIPIQIAGMGTGGIYVAYFLAPRVEDEGETDEIPDDLEEESSIPGAVDGEDADTDGDGGEEAG
jgi:hypothetical protein